MTVGAWRRCQLLKISAVETNAEDIEVVVNAFLTGEYDPFSIGRRGRKIIPFRGESL
jgi:hypothetical protein